MLPIPATGHSTLTADFSGCAPKAARRFLRGQSVPARCPGTAAFVALPPAPLSLAELRAARGAPGVRGRAMSAAQLTQLDVTLEFVSAAFSGVSLDLRGGGLRGGRWSLNLDAKRPLLRLEQVEYLPGVVVTGTVYGIGTRRERSVLRLSGPRTPDGVLRIGLRSVTGRLGGRPLHARPGTAAAASAGRRLSSARLLRLARQATRRHPFGTTGP